MPFRRPYCHTTLTPSKKPAATVQSPLLATPIDRIFRQAAIVRLTGAPSQWREIYSAGQSYASTGDAIMINNRRSSAGLVVAALTLVLAGGSGRSAAATELPLPPLHKAVTVAAAAKKPISGLHLIRIASIAPLPRLVSVSRAAIYPLIIGITY
jgi:hypothetical protein